MLGTKDKLLYGATNDSWTIRDNGPEGVYVALTFSEFYKYPYFRVIYGTSENREEVFISTEEAKYLTFTKLTDEVKQIFIDSIYPRFNNLIAEESILSNLFSYNSLPDYSTLDTWK
ncbi:MAG: hypothetical protein IKR19_08265 [Acholeplasmatales bacterium]|nr:hypothetical protein [Acholeplasmatales bacterium]